MIPPVRLGRHYVSLYVIHRPPLLLPVCPVIAVSLCLCAFVPVKEQMKEALGHTIHCPLIYLTNAPIEYRARNLSAQPTNQLQAKTIPKPSQTAKMPKSEAPQQVLQTSTSATPPLNCHQFPLHHVSLPIHKKRRQPRPSPEPHQKQQRHIPETPL